MQPTALDVHPGSRRPADRLAVASLVATGVAWLSIFYVSSVSPMPLRVLPFTALSAGIAAGAVGTVVALRRGTRAWPSILATALGALTAAFWFTLFWLVANNLTLVG